MQSIQARISAVMRCLNRLSLVGRQKEISGMVTILPNTNRSLMSMKCVRRYDQNNDKENLKRRQDESRRRL